MKYNKKKKTYTVTLDLEPGRQYQFRYFVDGVYWCNDWEADGYIASGFGHDNSVVSAPEQAQYSVKARRVTKEDNNDPGYDL